MITSRKLFFQHNIIKFLKIFFLVGMLLGFFLYIPAGKVYSAIRSANFMYFGLALLLNFPIAFLGTLSTWILSKKQGIHIPLNDFYLFNLAIRFYSFFSPASVISTAMRWRKLSAGSKSAEALSAISFTRLFSIIVAVCLGLFWAVSKVNQDSLNIFLFIGLVLVLISGWLLITRLSPYLASYLRKYSDTSTHPLMRRILNFSGRYFDAIKVYSQMPYTVLVGVAFTHVGQELIGLLAHILLAKALGISLSIYDLGWLRSMSFLTALTPFTLVGGIGIREVSLVLAMSAFNVSPDLAAAFSFLVYARGVVFSLLCGILEFGSLMKSK